MTEIAREKFARLMAQIDELEERIENLEKQSAGDEGIRDAEEAAVIQEELNELARQLAQKRAELARVSDGCGKPHPQS